MFLRILLIVILLLSSNFAKDLYTFVVIPKTSEGDFFQEVKKGCEDATENLPNVQCIFHGSIETNPIEQVKIIEYYLKQEVDGIAISVIDSRYLMKNRVFEKARLAGIPIITFDSDISEGEEGNRLAYIGTDNFAFGEKIGEVLKKVRPEGGSICIQSGWKDSKNLRKRLEGIRYALHNRTSKLDYNNGWQEIERCPLFCRDDNKLALFQLEWAINESDVFIATGAWPQLDSHYEEQIKTFLSLLQSGGKTLIVGDTTPKQLELLSKGLSFYNIGQNPYMMGKESIKTLYKIVTNQPYKALLYTPLTYCTQKNYQECTKLK